MARRVAERVACELCNALECEEQLYLLAPRLTKYLLATKAKIRSSGVNTRLVSSCHASGMSMPIRIPNLPVCAVAMLMVV